MNYKNLTIISIMVTAIFVMPLFSFAEETVPGMPFQALQNQIDELWQHINNMPTGEVKAYAGKQINNFPPLVLNKPANVITLDLPKGDYISTTTVNASYYGGPIGPWGTPGWSAENPGLLSCKFVDPNDNQLTGHGVGGNVIGGTSMSLTMELHLWDPTIAILQCENITPWGHNGINEIIINQANWTLIKADCLDEQPPWPPF